MTRKDILQRKQKGKAILPEWKAALEGAVNQAVSPERFLDIEETEQLRDHFFNKVRHHSREHCFSAKAEFRRIVSEIRTSLTRHGARELVLFHRYDRFIGAVHLDAATIANALEDVWRVVEEDLCIAASDLSGGICLEENYYDECGVYISDGVLELTIWGEFAVE